MRGDENIRHSWLFGLGQDDADRKAHSSVYATRPGGIARQARAPYLRRGPARQGFLPPPSCGMKRGAGDVEPAVGLDARIAGHAGADAAGSDPAYFAMRSFAD